MNENKNSISKNFGDTYQLWTSNKRSEVSKNQTSPNCWRQPIDSAMALFESWKWNPDQNPDISKPFLTENCHLDSSEDSGIVSFESLKCKSDHSLSVSRDMCTEKLGSFEDSAGSSSSRWNADLSMTTSNNSSFELFDSDESPTISGRVLAKGLNLDDWRQSENLEIPWTNSFLSNSFLASHHNKIKDSGKSDYKNNSFDPFNPVIKSGSFDGCFVESGTSTHKAKQNSPVCKSLGILSNAISHGGDISRVPENILDARLTVVKYVYRLRKCWKSICYISQMHSSLAGKTEGIQSPDELNMISILNAFNTVIQQVYYDLNYPLLNPVLQKTMHFIEFFIKTINDNVIDIMLIKRLEKVINYSTVMIHLEYLNRTELSEPLEDQFRSEKLIPTWKKFMKE